jgi:hypothetical protein
MWLSGARAGLLAGSDHPFVGGLGQSAHEPSVLPGLAESTAGLLVGDRNYHSPKAKKELATMGI